MSRDYSQLQAFQYADKLALEIYKATQNFPKTEIYGLTSQIRRAAISVPTNIVEGSHRNTMSDYLRFLDIAIGSCAEVGYLLSISERLGYIDSKTTEELTKQHTSCIRLLQALIRSLREIKT